MSEEENYYDDILKNVHNKKKVTNDKVSNLHIIPKKETRYEMPRYEPVEAGLKHQCDLLYLPSDNNFKYCLVVVDVGSRVCDARPLRSKTSDVVLKKIQEIYEKGGILSYPKYLRCDSGSEFKADFRRVLQEKGVKVSIARVDRHRQVALVEAKNKLIGMMIFRLQEHIEEETGKVCKKWVSFLPNVIKSINKHVKTRKIKPLDPYPHITNDPILDDGTAVRLKLEHPIDYTTGERQHGNFRATDIRWTKQIYHIEYSLVQMGQPIMYKLKEINDAIFTYPQLQSVNHNEKNYDVPNKIKKKR